MNRLHLLNKRKIIANTILFAYISLVGIPLFFIAAPINLIGKGMMMASESAMNLFEYTWTWIHKAYPTD